MAALSRTRHEHGAIFTSRSDGTHLRLVLKAHQEQHGSAELAPGGDRVAITRSDRDEHPQLVVVDSDGRHPHRLGRAASATWSHDGSLLAFATHRGCAVAVEPFGEPRARIRGRCGHPQFSPDGQSVLFQIKNGCAVVRTPALSAAERVVRVLETQRPMLLDRTCTGAAWSPDGRRVAYQTLGCPYCDSEKARRAALRRLGVWGHSAGRHGAPTRRAGRRGRGGLLLVVSRQYASSDHGRLEAGRGDAGWSEDACAWARGGVRVVRGSAVVA